MYFHSIPFLCFIPVVAFCAAMVEAEKRWAVLLGASFLFYAWSSPVALLFLAAIIVVAYVAANFLGSSRSVGWKRTILVSTIIVIIGILGLAKYSLKSFIPDFVVPLGLSFYSFQALGYLIDVSRGQREVERHFGRHSLFIAFFPTLLSGPVERSSTLLPQLRSPREVSSADVRDNVLLLYSGLFKKLVIADALAHFVSPIFLNPGALSGVALFIGVFLARYMIYADFSGYSDMAVSAAGLVGITVRQNFRRPFFATSLIDYWRRWHVSLHDWMKDYVFFSLAASPFGRLFGVYLCLLVSFLFMGVWHDVGWTFLAVGLWHGIFISLDYWSRDKRLKFAESVGLLNYPLTYKVLCMTITLVFFVLPPTVFFLSKSLAHAGFIFNQIALGGWSYDFIPKVLDQISGYHPSSKQLLIRTLLFLAIIEALHVAQANGGIRARIVKLPVLARWTLYVILFLVLIFFAQPFGERPYVYFQF